MEKRHDFWVVASTTVLVRSAWKMAYPRRRIERLFGPFCASSESRLLMLSIGLIVSEFTGDASFLLWLLWALAAAAYINFLVRIGLIYRNFGAGDHPK